MFFKNWRLKPRAIILSVCISLAMIFVNIYSVHKPNQPNGPTQLKITLKSWSKSSPPSQLKPTLRSRSQRISCSALIRNDPKERQLAMMFMKNNTRIAISNQMYKNLTYNCEDFRYRRGYIETASQPEVDFPLAFSIVMFKDVEQTERLLRAIYRPHNVYCIHIDAKADAKVKDTMASIVQCLPNVFLSKSTVAVWWGKFSVLEAELICMRELLKHKKWKYFINLTGQEFPLKTNLQLVKVLQAYDGANDIEGVIHNIPDRKQRWESAGPPPHNIRPVKGAVHIVVNRQYVDYAINNATAQDLLDWVKKTQIPDETFFSTLNHNPHLKVPGSYTGKDWTNPKTKPFMARYKIWDVPSKCAGKFSRHICIFGIGDLPRLTNQKALIANKFHLEHQPLTLDCLEEWYLNQTVQESQGHTNFDNSYYKKLGFVQNKVDLS